MLLRCFGSMRALKGVLVLAACMLPAFAPGAGSFAAAAEALPDTIERIKPSVVGIAVHQHGRNTRTRLLGTGFIVEDGLHVVTNDHVIPEVLDTKNREFLGVAVVGPRGSESEVRPAVRVAVDKSRDLVLLRIEGKPLRAMELGDPDRVREGQAVAFMGFPIGSVLGLVPATHRGIIAAVTPIALPGADARSISPATIRRLRDTFDVYQLDATAYPGNSGGPLFDPRTGEVLGVVNMVFVKSAKESALERPSGISYAIPVRHVRELLAQPRVGQP